jgi:parallel beta-helix repeat protein
MMMIFSSAIDVKPRWSGYSNISLDSGITLDVYTQKGGRGPMAPSDAFGPYDTVFLYANATNYPNPIQNLSVMFNVSDPYGNLYISLANITNADGIAVTNFRFPWPCSDPEYYFGNWTVLATSPGMMVNDTVRFEYGYLVEILTIEAGLGVEGCWIPKSIFGIGDPIDVRIEIKTICQAPINVCALAVVVDELGVPIGQDIFNYTIAGRTIQNSFLFLGTIPKWAFLGTGTVYGGLFSADPRYGGTAFCPEKTVKFLLSRYSTFSSVSVPGDFPTIQKAIQASENCTKIFVAPGIYHESIVVDREFVWIYGSSGGRTIIDGEGLRLGFNVTSYFVKITGVTIFNCTIGLWVENSSYNTFYHNNFIDDEIRVHVQNSFNNSWDNGCEGNYWSDYKGTDLDGDGIGDTPYIIDENDIDNYPLMSPYFLGDLNHDSMVDIYDVTFVCICYNSKSGDYNWNARCDIVEDGVIDIYDVTTVCICYGNTWELP